MTAFNLQVMIASEMVRVLGNARNVDALSVRRPGGALRYLRQKAALESSSEFSQKDRMAAESLALKLFFFVFWGETLDVKCGENGAVTFCETKTSHCSAADCCGPLPVWQDWLEENEPGKHPAPGH